jgi:hypothetical protein
MSYEQTNSSAIRTLLFAGAVAASAVLAGPAPAAARQRPSHAGHEDRGAYEHGRRLLAVLIPNHLTKRQARHQVKKALAGLKRDYSLFVSIDKERWRGNRLQLYAHVLGLPAVGEIEVTRSYVTVRVLLPASLSMLVDVAQPAILKAGTKMLAKK